MLVFLIIYRCRALSQLRAQEIEKQAALNEERARISRDMHDELGGGLAQLKMLVELSDRKGGDRHVERASKVASEMSGVLRDIVFALNSRANEWEDLVEQVRKQMSAMFGETGIHLSFRVGSEDGQHEVSPQMKRQVLFATREIGANIIRHSRASDVSVDVESSTDHIRLEIRDDGVGFDVAAMDGIGNGIGNIHQRIESIGGTVGLDSNSVDGTRYRLWIPLGEAGKEERSDG